MASEDSKYSPEARDVIFTVPNAISALRIISIPFIAWLIAEHRMVGALILLAISSASDGVDGLIARKCNQVSKIGQILDPIADRLLILCSILALAVCNVVPWWMVVLVIARDVVMGILTWRWPSMTMGRFRCISSARRARRCCSSRLSA